MIVNRDLANYLFGYNSDTGDLIHLTGPWKGSTAGFEVDGYKIVSIDRRCYPYWKIIAMILCDEFPVSVIYIDGDKLNTCRRNLKFIKPII